MANMVKFRRVFAPAEAASDALLQAVPAGVGAHATRRRGVPAGSERAEAEENRRADLELQGTRLPTANTPSPDQHTSLTTPQIVVFYAVLFTVPSVAALLYSRGKTQLTREELLNTPTARAHVRYCPQGAAARRMFTPDSASRSCTGDPPARWQMAQNRDPDAAKEKRQQMNAVLFEAKGSKTQEWAEKRDKERLQQPK